MPICSARRVSASFALPAGSPARERPEMSPFTSWITTGTPAADRPSARTWSVTVLPVPVAPVMRPWRLA